MCGIVGWVDWDKDLSGAGPTVEAMAATLAPRGPDAHGTWLSPHAAFAHRRLIVVDPAGGVQPMTRKVGERRCTLVYNGELYNTAEIRRDLAARGCVFRGHSDTEVLLMAFMEWGPQCLPRLNGIFAFAVWSEPEQTLFLARDRLGVKPLFYTRRGSSFLFASEIKALLAHPAVPAEVDAEGLAEVFGLGPARTPGNGVFRGIEELKPGYYLQVERSGLRVKAYWTLASRPHPDDLETTTAKVRALVQDAVERQLVADVPVCTLLSGGLDSSALTFFAAQALQRKEFTPLPTYSVDYVDNARHFRANAFQPDPDAAFIPILSQSLGTEHHEVVIDTPELVQALKTAVCARDLPGMADVDASLYLFCREIKKGATVALSGECADEVFGGYPWFYQEEARHAATFPWSLKLKARVRLLSLALKEKIDLEAHVQARYQEALAEVPRLPDEPPHEARTRELFYLNLTRWMPVLLDRKDRMSMAVGLEVRVPFCDHRLVEYVWNIPWEMKFYGQEAKGILRRALAPLLPAAIVHRRKSPYPKTHHPAYLEAVRAWLLEILADPASPLLPLIDCDYLRRLARSDLAEFDFPWFGQLMTGPQLLAYLCQVDFWLREYRITLI